MISSFLSDKGENYPHSAAMFPISEETNLQAVEEKITKDLEYRHFLTKQLDIIKSENLADLVNKIMVCLFDDNLLLVFFNKNRKTEPKNFMDLKISELIISSIRQKSMYNRSYEEIKILIQAHMTQAFNRTVQSEKDDVYKAMSGVDRRIAVHEEYMREVNCYNEMLTEKVGCMLEICRRQEASKSMSNNSDSDKN